MRLYMTVSLDSSAEKLLRNQKDGGIFGNN